MKITQEDIDNIISEIKSSGFIHNSTQNSWDRTFKYASQVEFLWKMYQELTENKGE